MEVKLGKS